MSEMWAVVHPEYSSMLPQINPKHFFQLSSIRVSVQRRVFVAIQQIKNIIQVHREAECTNAVFKQPLESTCHSLCVKGVGVLFLPAELLSIFSDTVSKPAIT